MKNGLEGNFSSHLWSSIHCAWLISWSQTIRLPFCSPLNLLFPGSLIFSTHTRKEGEPGIQHHVHDVSGPRVLSESGWLTTQHFVYPHSQAPRSFQHKIREPGNEASSYVKSSRCTCTEVVIFWLLLFAWLSCLHWMWLFGRDCFFLCDDDDCSVGNDIIECTILIYSFWHHRYLNSIQYHGVSTMRCHFQ